MLKEIDIVDLQPGMYVTQVIEQEGGFRVTSSGRIRDTSEIETLVNRGIRKLEIDLSKSLHAGDDQQASLLDQRIAGGLSYSEQLSYSMRLYEQAKNVHHKLIMRISKGKPANLEEVNVISQDIMAKIFECEDAISIVTLFNENDQYFIEHSINCAILIILFSRYLGFDDKITMQLGAGALLMDIGMVKLPLLLTEKPESFNFADTEKMHKHVRIALEMVDRIEAISEVSKEVIEFHHERLDGSGYPEGLTEQHISVYGRMAAIVDIYDALTSKRPYREAYKPAEALRFMSENVSGLDKDLIAKFILCIGANPIGSLVKLSDNKLGIVMRLNRHNPLNPVVMIFYDLATRQHDEVSHLDLSKSDVNIVGSVDPADFGVSLSAFLRQTLTGR